MDFRISALKPEAFAPLFALPADRLASCLAVRCTVTRKPGFVCRVSLEDADVGEEVLLVNYMHQGVASPYRASHAIFVRKAVAQAKVADGEVPQVLRSRDLSLRAFDEHGMILAADLCEGRRVEHFLMNQLAQPCVAYVHIHFARFGCYAARADRI